MHCSAAWVVDPDSDSTTVDSDSDLDSACFYWTRTCSLQLDSDLDSDSDSDIAGLVTSLDTPIEYPFSALDTAGWRQNWHLAYNNLTPEIPKGSSLGPLRNAASLSDSRKIGQLTKTTSCNSSGRC